MRWSNDKWESPKIPMSNVVVATIVMAQMKVAALAMPGGRRAAIQTNKGHRATMASSPVQGLFGKNTRNAHSTHKTASANALSAASRVDGALRINDAKPITSGATVSVPRPSEANQCSHTVGADALESPWNQTNPIVPTIPEIAVPTIVAANSPSTRRRVLSSNGEPYDRSIRPATMAASAALAMAKRMELQMLRSPSRFARTVAAITPRIRGHRALEPATMRTPEATPAAGQNTATPSGFSRRARLNRADRK